MEPQHRSVGHKLVLSSLWDYIPIDGVSEMILLQHARLKNSFNSVLSNSLILVNSSSTIIVSVLCEEHVQSSIWSNNQLPRHMSGISFGQCMHFIFRWPLTWFNNHHSSYVIQSYFNSSQLIYHNFWDFDSPTGYYALHAMLSIWVIYIPIAAW